MNIENNIILKSLVTEINGVVYSEQWKDVVGWEDLYEISSFGRVKRKKKYIAHYAGGLSLLKEKIVKPNLRRGYLAAHLYRNESDKAVLAIQRMVAIAFVPNPENKPTVNHIDTVKTNNFYKNLEWSSYSEQQIHAVKNNLRNNTIGEKSNFSKLKKDDIVVIRDLYSSGALMTELAIKFNTVESNIRFIVNRQTWKHI